MGRRRGWGRRGFCLRDLMLGMRLVCIAWGGANCIGWVFDGFGHLVWSGGGLGPFDVHILGCFDNNGPRVL